MADETVDVSVEEVKPGPAPKEFEGLDELLNFHDGVTEEVVDTTVESILLDKPEGETAVTPVVTDVTIPNQPEVKPVVDTVITTSAEPTEGQIIENLRAEILRLSRGGAPAQPTQPVTQTTQTETKTDPVTPPVKVWPVAEFDIKSIISDEELDQMIDRPELIREALNKVRLSTLQETQTMLPNLIRGEVNKQVTISKLVTDFYDMNRDLIPFADYVSSVMQEEETKSPTKTYKEIFDTVAAESRKRLGLKNVVAADNVSRQETTPAFAGSRRGSNIRPATAGTQQGVVSELADMMGMKDRI